MDWPAQWPDLNPIEHAWYLLDIRVRHRPDKPRNKQDLYEKLQEEWYKLDSNTLKNLVHSMPQRCQAVIEANVCIRLNAR